MSNRRRSEILEVRGHLPGRPIVRCKAGVEQQRGSSNRGDEFSTHRRFVRCFFLSLIVANTAFSQRPSQGEANPELANGERLYQANCATCHGADGDEIQGVDLHSGHYRHAESGDQVAAIVRGGIPGTAMPPNNLPQQQILAIVAFLRNPRNSAVGALPRGNRDRGKAIFERNGGCLSCHSIDGKGSRVGPDLTDIGNLRQPDDLQRSILDPNGSVLPEYRFVELVSADGTMIQGRRLNEDPFMIELIDSTERLLSLQKEKLRSYRVLPDSPMPSYQTKLGQQEVIDLVTYLATLKGVPVTDYTEKLQGGK